MTHNSNIDEILAKMNKCIQQGEGVEYDYYGKHYMVDEPFSLAEAKQAIQQLLDEAYKKGYIDGGIGIINEQN